MCNTLAEEAYALGLTAKVIDFEDFTPEEFVKHSLVLMCIATHYEGDPCDNTKRFHKWLRTELKTAGAKPFENMKYAIMGLGDTSYELFNEMGV